MQKSLWKAFLWQGVGLLFYFAGMLVFLVVAVNVFLSPPANSLENLSDGHVVSLLVSVVLIVVGRLIGWKFGGDLSLSQMYRGAPARPGSDQSRLEQLGYQVRPEASEERPDPPDDGEPALVCRECGAHNEPGYRYCGNCSSELPDSAQ